MSRERADRSPTTRTRDVLRQSSLTSLVSAFAFVTALVVDVTIAARFGVGPATDSLFVAARIPLALVSVVIVGANQVLVPTISTWLVRRGDREAYRLISALLGLTLLLGGLLSGIVAAVALPLTELTAPGLDPEQLSLAASLTRTIFLIVPLSAAAEVLRAFLNARYSFAAPAGMSVVMDAVTIAVITIWTSGGVHAVAWAFVGGAVAQLAFIGIMAARRGFRYRATLGIRDPDVAGVGRLLVRPMVGAGLNPLARVGEQLIVSFMPTGSISLLNYGYRLISVVGGGILFRPVIVTILPRLTEATSSGRTEEVREVTRLALKMMLAISLPLTALAAVLAQPATLVIFRRGSFSGADAALLGILLATYSLSLVGSAVQRALLAPFYARLETRVPFRNTLYGVCANLALAPPLVLLLGADRREGILGVAVAYSLAQYVNATHAWVRLRAIGIILDRVWSIVWRLGVVGVVGTAVLVAADGWLDLGALEDRWSIAAKIAAAAAASIAVMTGVLILIAGRDIRRLRASLRRRGPAAGTHDVDDPGGPTENLS